MVKLEVEKSCVIQLKGHPSLFNSSHIPNFLLTPYLQSSQNRSTTIQLDSKVSYTTVLSAAAAWEPPSCSWPCSRTSLASCSGSTSPRRVDPARSGCTRSGWRRASECPCGDVSYGGKKTRQEINDCKLILQVYTQTAKPGKRTRKEIPCSIT